MIPIGDDPPPRRSFPIVTITLIALNVIVFIYELSLGNGIDGLFRSAGVVPQEFAVRQDLPPPAPLNTHYSTLITSMFLHGGFLHIGSNMLYLWIFGDNVEERLGHGRYLLFYLLCGLGASAAHVYFNWGSRIPSVGASGAIAGVLAGYFVLFPSASVRTLLVLGLFVTVTRVPALIMIGIWFVTQFVSGLGSIGDAAQTSGVAYWAHIGGFVVGLPLVLLLRGQERRPSYSYH
jgi:membrane associated rhomboid family serine protease